MSAETCVTSTAERSTISAFLPASVVTLSYKRMKGTARRSLQYTLDHGFNIKSSLSRVFACELSRSQVACRDLLSSLFDVVLPFHGLSISSAGGSVLTRRILLGCCVATCDGVPVDHVEKCRHIVGTTVLIVQVVGMLPDIQARIGVRPSIKGES